MRIESVVLRASKRITAARVHLTAQLFQRLIRRSFSLPSESGLAWARTDTGLAAPLPKSLLVTAAPKSGLAWARRRAAVAAVLCWSLVACHLPLLLGQQASTGAAPLYNANAKYVQGVGPGYWPTAGAGLTLNLAAGTAMCGSPPALVTYSGGTLTLTASQTNYVYLDPSASCAPAFNTAGFQLGQIPLARVVTATSSITAITDARSWFVPQPMGMNSAGIATLTSPTMAAITDSTSQQITTFPSAGYIPWWFNALDTQPAPTAWNSLQPVGIGLTALDGGFNVN